MNNIKRYIIKKNDIEIGQADITNEIIKVIGCTRQHFNHTLKQLISTNEGCTFNRNNFKLIDKLEIIKNI